MLFAFVGSMKGADLVGSVECTLADIVVSTWVFISLAKMIMLLFLLWSCFYFYPSSIASPGSKWCVLFFHHACIFNYFLWMKGKPGSRLLKELSIPGHSKRMENLFQSVFFFFSSSCSSFFCSINQTWSCVETLTLWLAVATVELKHDYNRWPSDCHCKRGDESPSEHDLSVSPNW